MEYVNTQDRTSNFLQFRLLFDSECYGRGRLKKQSGSAAHLVCHSASSGALNDDLWSAAGIISRHDKVAETPLLAISRSIFRVISGEYLERYAPVFCPIPEYLTTALPPANTSPSHFRPGAIAKTGNWPEDGYLW